MHEHTHAKVHLLQLLVTCAHMVNKSGFCLVHPLNPSPGGVQRWNLSWINPHHSKSFEKVGMRSMLLVHDGLWCVAFDLTFEAVLIDEVICLWLAFELAVRIAKDNIQPYILCLCKDMRCRGAVASGYDEVPILFGLEKKWESEMEREERNMSDKSWLAQ